MIGNKEEILEWMGNKEGPFEIKEKRKKELRSLFQNRYYFGVVVSEISQFHGYTPVETHELIKLTVGLETTTNLDTSDFKFMIDLVRDVWKTKFDLYIPLPNEVEELKSIEQYFYN